MWFCKKIQNLWNCTWIIYFHKKVKINIRNTQWIYEVPIKYEIHTLQLYISFSIDMIYRYLFHNTQSKLFRRILHFKGVCDKQKINLKQVWVNLIKFISLCMYSFIFMQDNWEILMKERYRLFSPKMFKLNTY